MRSQGCKITICGIFRNKNEKEQSIHYKYVKIVFFSQLKSTEILK